jgi:hypothetical protein
MTQAGPIQSARFKIGRRIGEGGMGTVYEAFDGDRGERVAIKVLKQKGTGSLGRFKREFRALADLYHPNLVTLGELVSEGAEWFFSMELVDGEDFIDWVTGPASAFASMRVARDQVPKLRFDERRLRAALGQLAQGVSALHDAQKIHRDLKPSNVLVEPSGRLVVLDFGLVHDLSPDLGPTMTDHDVVGTPAYMAPEQAASRAVGPAADWYAVGVMLYEAMTGELPFNGAPLEVLLDKQKREPPPAETIAPGLPPDLAELCTKLLRFDPAQRPTGRQVMRALDVLGSTGERSVLPSSMSLGVPFVGRESELASLRQALQEAREGRAVTMLVRGESGIGKTCLVRHFTESMIAQDRNVLVLQGRCYEREDLPFKAFDGVIDAIAHFLARLPRGAVDRFLPTRPGRLLQLFPVLRRVDAIAQAPGRDDSIMDPHETRTRAFGAIREMLARIAEAHPLVMVIDDLQWADGDSFALLAEILRPPEEAAFLLIATIRTGGDAPARPLDPTALLPGVVRTMEVARLPRSDARALVAKLVERIAPELAVSSDTLAEEADGHPLFIDEIVRHLFLVGATHGPLRLEDALWSRVLMLEDLPRRVIEVLAVATSPLPLAVVAKATEANPSEFARILSFLRVAHLVRSTGTRGNDVLEVFHGRVRDAVLENLSDEVCKGHNLRIAIALEATGSREEYLLAVHWLGAGDVDRAAKHMLVAAERTAEALAFERAASLYAWVIELRERTTRKATPDDLRALHRKLGDALVNAGRGAQAARAYRSAATGANAAEALDLQHRAADQLMRSGHLDEGLAAVQEVLAAIGLKMPASPWRALVAVVLWRVVIALRGLRYRLRDASHAAAQELTRIDVCYATALSLSMADPLSGQVFQARNILWSLRCGEARRVCRALSLEVGFQSTYGWPNWKHTSRLDAEAYKLAKQIGDPYALGWWGATSGVAHYLAGLYEEGLKRCNEAERVLVTECVGVNWELASARLFALQSLAHMGRLKELSERQPVALRAAIERGDLYSAVGLRTGHPNLVWLLAGDSARARHEVTEAIREWSKRGFHLEHYFELLALSQADLYDGQAGAAYDRIAGKQEAIRRSFITRVQGVRISLWQLRARAALGVAATDSRRHAEALAVAKRDARSIARVGGDDARAVTLLARAEQQAKSAKLGLIAMAASHARGALVGGDEGKRLVASSIGWAAAQGAKAPERILPMAAPGLITASGA